VNIECLYLSHNLVRDLYGIANLTTLVELNLSFNNVEDIKPLEDLTLLEKLYLNRNHIINIDPILKLQNLLSLGLFHNEILSAERALEIFESLSKLRDLSIDGNPCSSKIEFKYELMLRIPTITLLDEEPIKEFDVDIAKKYFEINNIPLPLSKK